jgi:uncharacterized protein YPO0396
LADDGAATASARDAALLTEKATEAQLRALQEELTGLEKRRGNVPENLHRARVALAAAAGLAPEQLPFVGELVEVQVAHENWRDAFNLALGGFATTLLVPDNKLAEFRAAIDAVPVPVRVRFEGVPTGINAGQTRVHLDPTTLPGRLDYANSPFADALKNILANRFGFVCVTDAAKLGDYNKALTRSGQSSEGHRGAHGGSGRNNVLGFTNARAIQTLETQIQAKRQELEQAAQNFRGADLRIKALRQQQAAATLIARTTWEAIDIKGAAQAVARWQDLIENAETDNPEAADLSARATALDAEIQNLTEKLGSGKSKGNALSERWEAYSAEVDAAQAVLDQAAETGMTVSAAARDYLNEALGGAGASTSNGTMRTSDERESAARTGNVTPAKALANFDAIMNHAAERLATDQTTARTALDNATNSLRTVFQHFVQRWPNPNLGTDPDASYGDFERILLSLETEGLHALEAEWSRSLAQLTGADLADLDRTLRRALTEITERIQPVNTILAGLPFNDADHRLQITCQVIESALVTKFRRQLRELASIVPSTAPEERNAWYRKMAGLIERIRPGAPERADLIDVRRQVRLSAEKVDLGGNHVALYDHFGEKSGGESQELVAFIVGAALRYQLGDAGAERPRYAPVFLDEALIKADAKFTGRALGAWRGLGFQLVIGAPNDKVSALEPHVSASYVVVKNNQGRSQARPIVSLAA